MNTHWSGWAIIDSLLAQYPGATIRTLNQLFAENEALQGNIQAFYKANYWDDLNLSLINDQQIADNMFDCSVNPCIDGAGKVLQKAVNAVLTTTGNKSIAPLIVDGQPGTHTLNAVNALPAKLVFDAINTVRAANYHERVVLTPKDAEWLPVWLRRLVAYQQ
jgi:lysozyme family protein